MTIARIAIAGSDVAIARVGLGCSRIFGGRELRSSARLVEAALQAGITQSARVAQIFSCMLKGAQSDRVPRWASICYVPFAALVGTQVESN